MGLLKIAYEFATDTIKKYFLKDVKSKTISNLLYNADFYRLDNHKIFIGDGLQNGVSPYTNQANNVNGWT